MDEAEQQRKRRNKVPQYLQQAESIRANNENIIKDNDEFLKQAAEIWKAQLQSIHTNFNTQPDKR